MRLYCDLLTQQTHDIKNLIMGFNSSMNENKTVSSSRVSDILNEPSKFETHLDTLPLTSDTTPANIESPNLSTNLLKSNDNISMLSFKSAESSSFNVPGQDKSNTSLSTQSPEEDNLNGMLNENSIDPNLENIKVTLKLNFCM